MHNMRVGSIIYTYVQIDLCRSFGLQEQKGRVHYNLSKISTIVHHSPCVSLLLVHSSLLFYVNQVSLVCSRVTVKFLQIERH